MQYQDLVDAMAKIEAQRLTLVVHPEDEEKVQAAVRRIVDESWGQGQPILAPRITVDKLDLVEPGRVLIMAPKERDDGF